MILSLGDLIKHHLNNGRKLPNHISTIKGYWEKTGSDRDPSCNYNRYQYYMDAMDKYVPGVKYSRVWDGYDFLYKAFDDPSLAGYIQLVTKFGKQNYDRVVKIDFDLFNAYAVQSYDFTYNRWVTYGGIFMDARKIKFNKLFQRTDTKRIYIVQAYPEYTDKYQLYKLPELEYPENITDFVRWLRESGRYFDGIPKSSLSVWNKKARFSWSPKENITTETQLDDHLKKLKNNRVIEKLYHLPKVFSIDYTTIFQKIAVKQKDIDDFISQSNANKLWEIEY